MAVVSCPSCAITLRSHGGTGLGAQAQRLANHVFSWASSTLSPHHVSLPRGSFVLSFLSVNDSHTSLVRLMNPSTDITTTGTCNTPFNPFSSPPPPPPVLYPPQPPPVVDAASAPTAHPAHTPPTLVSTTQPTPLTAGPVHDSRFLFPVGV